MMTTTKLRAAITVIGTMEIGAVMSTTVARRELEYAVKTGKVDINDTWVMAALNCKNDADMIETAVENLLADCREGFIPEVNDGNDDLAEIAG